MLAYAPASQGHCDGHCVLAMCVLVQEHLPISVLFLGCCSEGSCDDLMQDSVHSLLCAQLYQFMLADIAAL